MVAWYERNQWREHKISEGKRYSADLFTSDTLKGGAKKPELAKVLCESSGTGVEWLMDRFNLDLSPRLSNILHTGRLSVFLVALSSCSTIFFHPYSAMGRGKQWSADTVLQLKTLMNIGLPLPRIAAQTGVVLQTLQRFSARVKKGYTGDKHGNHRGARPKQTDEMKRWNSDYLLANPTTSVSEVHVVVPEVGFRLVTNNASSHHVQPASTCETDPHAQGPFSELQLFLR